MAPYVKNEYVTTGPITHLYIGYKDTMIETLIDTDLVPEISQYHWRVTHKRNKIYVVTGQHKNGTQMYLHDICNRWPIAIKNYETDHHNGNSLDNRTENLRLITRQENIDNTKAN